MEEPEDKKFTGCYFFVHRLKTSAAALDFRELQLLSPALRGPSEKLSESRRAFLTFFFGRRNLSEVSRDEVLGAAAAYVALLRGLKPSAVGVGGGSAMHDAGGAPRGAQLGDLGALLKYSWRNILGAPVDTELNNTTFEIAAVMLNTGIWLLGYSDHLITNLKADSEEEKLKLAHDCLLKAAGIFEELVNVTKEFPREWRQRPLDFQEEVLTTFRCQAIAQAQEVTISMGVRRGTSAKVLGRLALAVADQYTTALTALNTVEAPVENRVSKWRQFITFKHDVYKAFGRHQQALSTMSGDAKSCGDAVSCVNAAKPLSDKAFNEVMRYSRLPPVKAEDQNSVAFVRLLVQIVDEDHRKLNLENDMVYYQHVSPTPPPLPDSSLITRPQDFALPAADAIWDAVNFAEIDAAVVAARQKEVAGEIEVAASGVEGRAAKPKPSSTTNCRIT
eukprot:TRINITY_DN6885_c0_g1_i2.p1 TRINITY_DN6885_c0_g1~~TRINITY_DN6885_c0_g1_i2.p1  ORF type:complete len:447 (-),score=134.86 TRINITY_DN6885_c0_g1_i2:260-1600(-)